MARKFSILSTGSLGGTFHHIGYAAASLSIERVALAALGYAQEGGEFADPAQGIRGCFLAGPGPRLELLENLPHSTVLTPWINLGVKMYHFAYEVVDLEQAILWGNAQRGRMIVAPTPAVAFEGRRICFFMFRNAPMIEFIEASIVRGR